MQSNESLPQSDAGKDPSHSGPRLGKAPSCASIPTVSTIPTVLNENVVHPAEMALASQTAFETLLRDGEANLRTTGMQWAEWCRQFLTEYWRTKWTTAVGFLLIIIGAAFLFVWYSEDASGRNSIVLAEAIIVLTLGTLAICVDLRETSLKIDESRRRLLSILDNARIILSRSRTFVYNDESERYQSNSRSISTIQVYRDNRIVSLPSNLLVKGDIILLCVGDESPARCTLVEMDAARLGQTVKLRVGETFKLRDPQIVSNSTSSSRVPSGTSTPTAASPRAPGRNKTRVFPGNSGGSNFVLLERRWSFRVEETPLIRNIQSVLNSTSTRPPTSMDHRFELVLGRLVYRFIIPGFLVISLAINAIRTTVLEDDSGNRVEMLAVLPFYVILPLLPITMPLFWAFLKAYGAASILALHDKLVERRTGNPSLRLTNARPTRKAPIKRGPFIRRQLNPDLVSLDSQDNDQIQVQVKSDVARLPSISFYVRRILTGQDWTSLSRSSNPFEALASVTIVCCVDKDGILSTSSASIDRLSFLRNDSTFDFGPGVSFRRPHREQEMNGDSDGKDPLQNPENYTRPASVVTLDLVRDVDDRTIRFVDPTWTRYINSLKVLGLTIHLRNQCGDGPRTAQVFDHLQSLTYRFKGKKVHRRRLCMCSLYDAIGMDTEAHNTFTIRKQVITFAPKLRTLEELSSHPSQKMVKRVLSNLPVSQVDALFTQERVTGTNQLFIQGSVDFVLGLCSDYWDGEQLTPLTPEARAALLSQYITFSRSEECTAFAYGPLPPSALPADESGGAERNYLETDCIYPMEGESTNKRVLELMMHQQGLIFMGLAAAQVQAKGDTKQLINRCDNAGIRFVFFSPDDELVSKPFAGKLGLETGWNCHISLKEADPDYDVDHGYLARSDNKARLPIGVKNIRQHLEEVDDVPLLVPMFTDCTPDSCKETISIMQEHGEVICCIGSVLHARNVHTFSAADIAIAAEPTVPDLCYRIPTSSAPNTGAASVGNINTPGRRSNLDAVSTDSKPVYTSALREPMQTKRLPNVLSHMSLSAALNGVPCALNLERNAPLSVIFQLIEQARRLMLNYDQIFTFWLGAALFLSSVQLLNTVILLPPIFTGLQLVWIQTISVPMLCLPMLITTPTIDIDRLLVQKNSNHGRYMWRYVYYWVVRFLTSAPILVICHLLTLRQVCQDADDIVGDCHPIFGAEDVFPPKTFNGYNSSLREGLSLSQNVNAFLVVLYFVVIAATFLQRNEPIWAWLPYKNWIWCISAAVVIVLQVGFFAIYHVSISSNTSRSYEIEDVPLATFLLGLLWLPFLLALQELMKHIDRQFWIRQQKRLKQFFDTKLGMHSPV
eukprot:Clim_evm117s157 gene=Clim_evmTU117s157